MSASTVFTTARCLARVAGIITLTYGISQAIHGLTGAAYWITLTVLAVVIIVPIIDLLKAIAAESEPTDTNTDRKPTMTNDSNADNIDTMVGRS